MNEPEFTGTPMPKDEPLAANPPFGAIVDYANPAGVTGPAQIAISDASGALVTSFSSNDTVATIDPAKLAVAPEWARPPGPPPASPGHHRFVWNLHYAPPAEFAVADVASRVTWNMRYPTPGLAGTDVIQGMWAPPGIYTVALTVGGRTFKQPLQVRPDPRVSVSQAEFDAQFRLARQIEQERVRLRSMLKQAGDLHQRLGKSAVASTLDALIGTATAYKQASAPTSLTTASEWLDKLASAVESADGAPTPDDLRSFALLSSALDNLEGRWRAIAAPAPQAK